MHKMVNDERVELTQTEIDEYNAKQSAAVAAQAEYEATVKYKDDRESEYPTIHDLTVALWEKIVEDRPEVANALQTERLAIKSKYPKPQA